MYVFARVSNSKLMGAETANESSYDTMFDTESGTKLKIYSQGKKIDGLMSRKKSFFNNLHTNATQKIQPCKSVLVSTTIERETRKQT